MTSLNHFLKQSVQKSLFGISYKRYFKSFASLSHSLHVVTLWHWNYMHMLSREYTCADSSHVSNKAASVRCDALVCMANFGMRKQPRFASCVVRPEPSAVGLSKWALAEASTAQVRSSVIMPRLTLTRLHFLFRGKSQCGTAQHAKSTHVKFLSNWVKRWWQWHWQLCPRISNEVLFDFNARQCFG